MSLIIVGGRVPFTKSLAGYLMSREGNEAIFIREIEQYPNQQTTSANLTNALQLMGTQALAKGKRRTLYHAVIALSKGKTLTKEQLKIAIDRFTANSGLAGHQRIIVEHWKHGRQHFHIVYNIINPVSGRLARLTFTRFVQCRTTRELNRILGFEPLIKKGRAIYHWEWWRGKLSGINPYALRKEVTAIFKASRTGAEFVASLARTGYILSIGRYNSYVLIDKAGDVHGLMRRIEGACLDDLKKKFPDLKNITLPPLDAVRKKCHAAFPRKKIARAYRTASNQIKRSNSRLQALARPAPPKLYRKASLSLLLPVPRPRRRKNEEQPTQPMRRLGKDKIYLNEPAKANFPDPEFERAELIAWAFRNGRFDILTQYGIFCAPETPET